MILFVVAAFAEVGTDRRALAEIVARDAVTFCAFCIEVSPCLCCTFDNAFCQHEDVFDEFVSRPIEY